MEVLVIGVEDGADGADDDGFFVEGGDEDGDAGVVAGRGLGVGLSEAVDDGEEAHDDEAGAHEDVAEEEDQRDELLDEGDGGEGDGVGDGAEVLSEGELGHDLGGGLAHEGGDGHDGVAAGAERVNEDGEGGNGGGTVAAAVVHEDDGAAELRLDLHGVELGEDGLGDFGGGLAGMLVPVVGVELAADDRVAVMLDVDDGGGLVVGFGLLVDVVGRAEVEGLNAELAGE